MSKTKKDTIHATLALPRILHQFIRDEGKKSERGFSAQTRIILLEWAARIKQQEKQQ